MKLKITVDDKSLERQIRKASEEIKGRVKEQVKESADNVKKKAKNNAPVDDGELKKRIIESFSKDGLSAVVVSKAPHSHLVEHGSKSRRHKSGKSVGTMPAQPFMHPATESERVNYNRGIKKAFEQ